MTLEVLFRLLRLAGLAPLAALLYFLITGAWLAAAGALLAYVLLSLPLIFLARVLPPRDAATPASRRDP